MTKTDPHRMTHVRAKFKYAAEIEHDANAHRFLEYIGKLYALEKRYEEEKFSAEQVRHFRNSTETTGIIIEMSSLLDLMKSENTARHGSLMEKAVSYLDHFGEPGFPVQEGRELHDKQQSCRTVHQTFGEQEEELTFLRKRQDGACQRGLPLRRVHLQGYSILEYLKKFFACGYGKLMSSTIGISANKL